MKVVQGAIIGMLVLGLASCSNELPDMLHTSWNADSLEPRVQDDLLKETKELTVWSYFDMTGMNEQFRERYPSVRFSYKQIAHEQFAEAYAEALIAGDPPDVLVIDNEFAGIFRAMGDAFDNLLEPPYSAEAYERRIPGNLRSLYFTQGGERLVGLPQNLTGAVMFYREDLFRAVGLPTDPEELAEYLADADRWLGAAQRLKDGGHFLFQQDSEPLDLLGMQEGFFDESLRYVRNTPPFVEMLEVARTVRGQSLSLGSSIWTAAGQEALRTGQLAAVYMGSWGIEYLRDWAPDTRGKWRATRLPMNLHGLDAGSFFAFPAGSKNKYLAWEYAKLATAIDKTPDFSTINEFLGGQDASHLFRAVPYLTKPPTPSPFDWRARQIWDAEMSSAIESGTSPGEALRLIQAKIESAVDTDRKHVLRYLEQEGLHTGIY